jgi:hypothetical protein
MRIKTARAISGCSVAMSLVLAGCESLAVAGDGGEMIDYTRSWSADDRALYVNRKVLKQTELLDLLNTYYLMKYEVQNDTGDHLCVRVDTNENVRGQVGNTIRSATIYVPPRSRRVAFEEEFTYDPAFQRFIGVAFEMIPAQTSQEAADRVCSRLLSQMTMGN